MDDFFHEEQFRTQVDRRLAQFFNLREEALDDGNYTLYCRIRDLKSRYTFFETIATGGMKTILRVHDARTDRYVAMAQLHDNAPEDLYEPFLREACLTARMEHPNIISIYDIGVDDRGRPYFTMELKGGDSLADILKKLGDGDPDYMERYPLDMLLGIFIKVCETIAYAHDQGVLHLDLKPSNIQVADFGEVKVCDWGAGWILPTKEGKPDRQLMHFDLLNSVPLFGAIHGTPGFMAPEQLAKENAEISFQTDVYSLGSILYSILSLSAPFEGDTLDIIRQTLAGNLSPMPCSIPVGLRAVIQKAMSLHPEQRYGQVLELLSDVRHYLSLFPTSAEGAGLGRRLWLFYKRNQRICRVVLLGVMLLCSVSLVFGLVLRERQRRIAEVRYVAGESLQKYEDQKEYSAVVERNYSSDLLFMNKLIANMSNYDAPEDLIIYDEMLRQLEVAEKLNTSDVQARVGRAIILFVLQRFNDSATLLETTPNWAWTVRELAGEYGAVKSDCKMLEAEEVATLVRELTKRCQRPSTLFLIEQLVSYDLKRRASLPDRALVIEALLDVYNPQWNHRVFRYDADRRSLVLGGDGLVKLKSKRVAVNPVSPLEFLQLHRLELQGAEFSVLEQLYGIPLVSLDVSDIRGHPYPAVFHRFRLLNELIVLPGQLGEGDRESLPEYLTVTELER